MCSFASKQPSLYVSQSPWLDLLWCDDRCNFALGGNPADETKDVICTNALDFFFGAVIFGSSVV